MKTPKPTALSFTILLLTCGVTMGHAEGQRTIDFEGRVTVAGKPFTGEGRFRFTLIDQTNQSQWTSSGDEAKTDGLTLAVNNGHFRVLLGDPTAGMPPLGSEVTSRWRDLRVRTSFDDGAHGWAKAGVSALASAPAEPKEAPTDMQQAIFAELRQLRREVSGLRQQLNGSRVAQPSPSPSRTPKPNPKPKPDPVQVSLADVERHSLGSADAPVVLVEFTDFECGFCKRFFDQTFPRLKEKYIDTGRLRFVSRHYPIKSHPQAGPAAEALLSAAAQDPEHYWLMRTQLFKNNRELNENIYRRLAEEAGLDVDRFRDDLAAGRYRAKLAEDVAAAKGAGITGTPSFVLGVSDRTTIRGERIKGAKSFDIFSGKIEALLTAAGDRVEEGQNETKTPAHP